MHHYHIRDISVQLSYPTDRPTCDTDTFWQYQWACGYGMAEHIISLDGTGKTLLDLGPGLGLCTIIASHRNFTVTAVDYQQGSLDYTLHNAILNNVPAPRCILQSWKEFDETSTGTYDVILAGDAFYNRSSSRELMDLFASHLAPNGTIYITSQVNIGFLTEELNMRGWQYTQKFITPNFTIEVPDGNDRYQIQLVTITP